jgi:transcriptional regulator with XRE-family HTH domain
VSDPLMSNAANGTSAMRWRMVGAALRRYRETSKYTLADAADVLECDRSKLSRIETGQRGIRARDLRDLLTEYGVGEHERAFLIALASPGPPPDGGRATPMSWTTASATC